MFFGKLFFLMLCKCAPHTLDSFVDCFVKVAFDVSDFQCVVRCSDSNFAVIIIFQPAMGFFKDKADVDFFNLRMEF